MSFAVGSLVEAREREWVVLPESTDDLLVCARWVAPMTKSPAFICPWNASSLRRFDLPDPTQIGDFASCRLLRDAVRLGFRSSAGRFVHSPSSPSSPGPINWCRS